MMEYSTAALYIAIKVSIVSQPFKKARGSSGQEKAQPTQQHCRNCGETGYNAHMYKIDEEKVSKSDASVSDVYSLASNKLFYILYLMLVVPRKICQFSSSASSVVEYVIINTY